MRFGFCRGTSQDVTQTTVIATPLEEKPRISDTSSSGVELIKAVSQPSRDAARRFVGSQISVEEEIAFLKGAGSSLRIGTLECDAKFRIKSADRAAERLLGWKSQDLEGKPITTLMSPLVGRIHQSLFGRIRKASPEQLDKMRSSLQNSMSNSREFAVFGKNLEPVVCGISIDLHMDKSSTVMLQQTDTKILHNVPLGFGQYIHATPGLYVKDYPDVICVMMDIAGSTQYASTVKPSKMAELMHDVYMAVNDVVLREVFPFAYIHEIVGDSILLIVNAGFMAKYDPESAIIAMHAASQMQLALDKMLADYSEDMHARVGISIGAVCAGVMDGRSFRVFGETVHLSQRLEASCRRGHIACQSTYYSLLEEQLGRRSVSEYIEANLKGFGTVGYNLISAGKAARSLTKHFYEVRQSMSFSPAETEAIRARISRLSFQDDCD